MPCYLPIQAWQTPAGAIIIGEYQRDAQHLELPCGKCIGCKTAAARAWALRCELELQQHQSAVFTTLTYDEKHLPITLAKRHVQLWLKRLRKTLGPNRTLRFFASGEYGEQTERPHYHAILYGIAETEQQTIHNAWAMGHTQTRTVTPAAIAYTAGYTSKKLGDINTKHERVDPETGEVYTWQPPFIQMSRRPGIGGKSREHTASWKEYAIHNGYKLPVPRYLHQAWKDQATEQEIKALRAQKNKIILDRYRPNARIAAHLIANAEQEIKATKRNKL